MGADGRPAPGVLWMQAAKEHPDDEEARRRRYIDLMREHGHIVPAKSGEDRNLPCGWPRLPSNLDDLLTPEQHAELNEDLARMARLRRQAEAECGPEAMW